MKPERMLCLWCPDWPVVAARKADPALEGVPVVVLDRGFVLAASAEARAEGVRRGGGRGGGGGGRPGGGPPPPPPPAGGGGGPPGGGGGVFRGGPPPAPTPCGGADRH